MAKLTFSKDSWHHNLVSWVMGEKYFDHPLNLCKYFWTVVYCLCFGYIHKGARMIPTGKRGRVILGFWAGWLGFNIYERLWMNVIIILAIAGALIGTVVILSILDESRFMRRERISSRPKKPNIAVEFLKAKKHKLCPYVFWDDDDNELQ